MSVSALVNLFSVQPTRTVCSDATVFHCRVNFPHRLPLGGVLHFWDSLGGSSDRRTSLMRVVIPACFIHSYRSLVTDSFSYPVAAIFHMAWFTVPLHARPVDEWLLSGIPVPHIPLPHAQRSALRGLMDFIQITRRDSVNHTSDGCDGRLLFPLYAISLCLTPTSLSHTHLSASTNLGPAGQIDYCC